MPRKPKSATELREEPLSPSPIGITPLLIANVERSGTAIEIWARADRSSDRGMLRIKVRLSDADVLPENCPVGARIGNDGETIKLWGQPAHHSNAPIMNNSTWKILLIIPDAAERQKVQSIVQAAATSWQVELVASRQAALDRMKHSPIDVVIADLNLDDAGGVDFLNQIWRHYPKTARFLLADDANREVAVNCVLGAHQILPRDFDAFRFRTAMEEAQSVDQLLQNRGIKELVRRMRTFPSLPSSYFEVIRELGSPEASAIRVGEIMANDLAMTTKMIQMVNSAYFGVQRQITDPTEAIMVLGMETVRSLVLSLHAFAQFDKVKPIYFSIDRIWKHSLEVARLAKKIAEFETGDTALANEAYMGGLMHDIGKLVLATNLDDQYSGALKLAKTNRLRPWEVEKQVFSASHGEIGAYLLSHWGLPPSVVEAAALHHEPRRSTGNSFSPLTAVHVANFLELQENPDSNQEHLGAELDLAYLQGLGLEMRVDLWQQLHQGEKPDEKSDRSQAAEEEAAEERNDAQTQNLPSDTFPPTPPSLPRKTHPVALTIAAAILIVLFTLAGVVLLRRSFEANFAAPPVRATEPPPQPPSGSAPPNPMVLNQPSPAPDVFAPPSNTTRENSTTATEVAKDTAADRDETNNELQLQGIVFSHSSPSAMINGRTLFQGDEIEGGRVILISQNSVVLDFSGRRQVLRLE